MLPAFALAQQPTELNVGWLSYSAGTISQDLSVRNNGLLPIKTVSIGCRFSHFFMHYSKQLGAGTVEIENIASNAIGYKTMTIASKISPNNRLRNASLSSVLSCSLSGAQLATDFGGRFEG